MRQIHSTNIKFVFDEAKEAVNQFGDMGSIKTFRSVCHSLYNNDHIGNLPTATDHNNQTDRLVDQKSRPGELNTESNSTQATSTLADSTNNPKEAFLKLCQPHPNLLQNLLRSNP